MKMVTIGILGILMVFVMATPLFAEDAGTKLGRGLMNIATGWLEIPKNIHDVSKESNVLEGLVVGSVKGAGYAVARTGAGGLETGTFVFPPYDKPMIEPERVY